MNYKIYGLFSSENSIIRYIGLTSGKVLTRFSAHKRNAFQKYREDYNCYRNCWIRSVIKSEHSLKYIILKDNLSEEEAKVLEIQLIALLGREDLKKGVLTNTDDGGTGGHRIKTKNELLFVKSLRKSVKQYNFDGSLENIWKYILQAEKETKIPNSKITSVCRGKRNSAGGFIWRYLEDDFNKYTVKNTIKKGVDVYNVKGEYLTTFKTSTQCSKALHESDSNIVSACNGKQASYGGYVIRWEGEPFNKYELNTKRLKPNKINEDIVQTLGKPRIIKSEQLPEIKTL